MKFQDYKSELLSNDGLLKEYKKIDLAFEISKMLINARIIKGITQSRLAKMIHTKQSAIARLENGNGLPSLTILAKIAKAYKTELIPPRFSFLDENLEEVKFVTKSDSGYISESFSAQMAELISCRALTTSVSGINISFIKERQGATHKIFA